MLSVQTQALAGCESSFSSLPCTHVQIVLFMCRPQGHPHTMPPIWKVRLEQTLFTCPGTWKMHSAKHFFFFSLSLLTGCLPFSSSSNFWPKVARPRARHQSDERSARFLEQHITAVISKQNPQHLNAVNDLQGLLWFNTKIVGKDDGISRP